MKFVHKKIGDVVQNQLYLSNQVAGSLSILGFFWENIYDIHEFLI